MKSINTDRGSTYTLAPGGSFDQCAKDAKRLKLVEEQLSQLQEDFGLLNKEVEDFGSSFNTASAHITKLEANNASVKETLTAKELVSEILKTKKIVKNFEERQATESCIVGTATEREADLDIVVSKDGLSQYVKVKLSGNTVISQGAGADYISDFRLYTSGVIEILFPGTVDVLVYSESKGFTAFKGTRSENFKSIPVNNEITISGKVNFDNGQSISYNNIDSKSLVVEEYALLGQTHIKLNEAPVAVKSCARIAWDTGLASYNDGSIKICYQDGKLVYAIMPNNAKIIKEGVNDYIVYTGTLTSDYVISPGSVPAFVETPIPVGYTTLCENETFLDGLTTDILKANTVETDRANIASGEINVLATDRANINDLNSTDLNTVTATVQGLFSAGQVKFTRKISLPEILPTEKTDVVFDLHSGMIIGSVVDSDKNIIASFTAVKNTSKDYLLRPHSSFIISYSQSKLGNLHTFKELDDGRFAITTRISGKELYYGYVSTENEMPVETIVDNGATIKLSHEVTSLQHSVILGDHTSEYGLAVDGEVDADLVPFSGTTSFDDVYIKNSLEVDGPSNLMDTTIGDGPENPGNLTVNGDTSTTGNSDIGLDLTVTGNVLVGTEETPTSLDVNGTGHFTGDVSIDGNILTDTTIGTEEAPANLVVKGETVLDKTLSVSGNTTVGSEVSPSDLTVNGNTFLNGDMNITGNVTSDVRIGTSEKPASLAVSGTTTIAKDTTIGTPEENANLVVNGTATIAKNTTIGTKEAPADLTVTGNIYQKGEAYDTHAEQVYIKDSMFITREGAELPLSEKELTGIKATHYDDDGNNGILGFDKTGTARVGDEGKEQAIATRAEEAEMINGNLVAWDGTDKKLITPKAAIVDGHTLARTDDALMLYGAEGMDNIPEGSLDTVVKCGQYSADDGLAAKITEVPAGETGAFDLVVGYFNTDSTLPYQVYTNKSSQKVFFRMTFDGMYDVWRQITDKAQVDSLIKSAVDAAIKSEAKARADADTAIINGTTPVAKVTNNATNASNQKLSTETWVQNTAKAHDSGLLESKTKAQVVSEARNGLASTSWVEGKKYVTLAGLASVPIKQHFTAKTTYSDTNIIDYMTRTGVVSWSQSEVNETILENLAVGDLVTLRIVSSGNVTYEGLQQVSSRNGSNLLLMPRSYTVVSRMRLSGTTLYITL